MTLTYVQIAVSVLLIIAILLQQKGSGLSSAVGGGMEYATKRGAEKVLHYATIVLAALFVISSVARLFQN